MTNDPQLAIDLLSSKRFLERDFELLSLRSIKRMDKRNAEYKYLLEMFQMLRCLEIL